MPAGNGPVNKLEFCFEEAAKPSARRMLDLRERFDYCRLVSDRMVRNKLELTCGR